MHPDNAQSRTVEVSPIAKLLMRYFQRTEVGAIGLSMSFSFPTGQVIHAGLHDKLLRDTFPVPQKEETRIDCIVLHGYTAGNFIIPSTDAG